MRYGLFFVLLVSLVPPVGAGTITNGGFETGNLTGWSSSGAASVVGAGFGSGPTEGSYEAFLSTGAGAQSRPIIESFLGLPAGTLNSLAGPLFATEGSAIKQVITANAGDVLSFDWNFLTNEATPNAVYNDFAFWVLVNEHTGQVLANTFSSFSPSSTSFFEETGFTTTSYTFSTSGTFTLGFGVMDAAAGTDTAIDSGLLVDNVRLTAAAIPEPPTAILASIAAVITGFVPRRNQVRWSRSG